MALGWRGSYIRYRGFFLNIVSLYRQRADLRAFVEIILSISTITIFLLFALKPTALTIIALISEINEKKATVVTLNQKISDLQQAQTKFNQFQGQISNLDLAVPAKPQPDTISKQVIGLAAKDSVKIVSFSVGQVSLVGPQIQVRRSGDLKVLPGDANEMNISINVEGDYGNLVTFAADLENLRIETKVDALGISTSSVNGQSSIVALISGRIPYLGN